jgi:hypothetical protein
MRIHILEIYLKNSEKYDLYFRVELSKRIQTFQ